MYGDYIEQVVLNGIVWCVNKYKMSFEEIEINAWMEVEKEIGGGLGMYCGLGC